MAQSSKVVVYQFKITLKGSKPPIWRRIQVKSNITLGDIHYILQTVMGWENYHLHQFIVGGIYYGIPDPELDFEVEDEEKIKLNKIVHQEKDKFTYEYDFGDGWDHVILLEKILPLEKGAEYPICIDGKMACPPEDCGGIGGYYHLLETLNDLKHPDHDEMLEWVGEDFDPKEFDIDAINEVLKA